MVLTDFDYEEMNRLWEPRVTQVDPFGIDAPLAGRAVRWWPDLFRRRTRGVPARQAIENSSEGEECARLSLEEQRRLGLRRHDPPRAICWSLPCPRASSDGAPGSRRSTLRSSCPRTTPSTFRTGPPSQPSCATSGPLRASAPPSPSRRRWFEERPPGDFPRTPVRPSDAPPVADAIVAEVVAFGERMPLAGGDMTRVGDGLHAVIAMVLVNPAAPDAVDRARGHPGGP